MIFEKKIKVNGRPLEFIHDGSIGKFDIECDGVKNHSIYDIVKKEDGYISYNSGVTCCNGWVNFGMYKMLTTDTVARFCEEHKCMWLIDVIGSYFTTVSKILCKRNERGEMEFYENEKGYDDFLVAHLQKLSKNSAVFTIEMEQWNEELEDSENISIVVQYIGFTDINVDSVYLYLENGVVLFPEEH